MKLQWYCQNIHANSGYSDEARVFIRGVEKLGISTDLVGKNKKPAESAFRFTNQIDTFTPIVYHTYRHGQYDLLEQQYSIVRTMLEVSRIPQSWVYCFKGIDEVWVPNLFNYNSFRISGVPEEKIFIIPSPVEAVDPRTIPPYPLNSKKKFKFLSIFNYDVRERKGLDILLKTYTQAFRTRDDVCLVIKGKTSREVIKREYSLGNSGPEIEVVDKILSRQEMLGLYRSVSCFVLPSRGEGIGRPLLDAMMMGTPIITTGWSGQADYLHDSNAFLLDYRLKEVGLEHYLKYPGFYGSQWAEPNPDDLTMKMKKVRAGGREVFSRIVHAQRDMKAYSAERVCHKVVSRLKSPLRKKFRDIQQSSSIFKKLFPVYYPRVRDAGDIHSRSQQDFSVSVDSVVITGSGHALNRAYYYFYANQTINNVFFLEVEKGSNKLPSPLEQKKASFQQVAAMSIPIIIADKLQRVPDLYHTIINRIDTLPIYIFSG